MKAAALLFLIFVGYKIIHYLVSLVKLEAKGVKTFKFSATRQVLMLFYALFSAGVGGYLIYYSFTATVREELRLAQLVLAGLLLLLFGLTFWLHLQYAAYQGESTLRFDPADQELTLLSPRGKVRIRKSELARVQWVKCAWPLMVWSEYEYLVLHLHNGSRLLLTSLLVPLPELAPFFAGKEIRVEKRVICRIKKNF